MNESLSTASAPSSIGGSEREAAPASSNRGQDSAAFGLKGPTNAPSRVAALSPLALELNFDLIGFLSRNPWWFLIAWLALGFLSGVLLGQYLKGDDDAR